MKWTCHNPECQNHGNIVRAGSPGPCPSCGIVKLRPHNPIQAARDAVRKALGLGPKPGA